MKNLIPQTLRVVGFTALYTAIIFTACAFVYAQNIDAKKLIRPIAPQNIKTMHSQAKPGVYSQYSTRNPQKLVSGEMDNELNLEASATAKIASILDVGGAAEAVVSEDTTARDITFALGLFALVGLILKIARMRYAE